MYKRSDKTSKRVIFNTCLLFIVSVTITLLTVAGIIYLRMLQTKIPGYATVPSMCYEEDGYDEPFLAYTCPNPSEGTEAINAETEKVNSGGQTLYLQNQLRYAYELNSLELRVVVYVVGIILSLSSFTLTFVYWNHNRRK